MRTPAAAVALVLAVGLVACGGGGEKKEPPKRDARNPQIQKQVSKKVKKETEQRIEDATGAYADPELEPTNVDCIPESDTKLSCVVDGYANQGFGDEDTASGSFQWRWEVVVDPDTGRFQARPVEQGLPQG